MKPADAQACEAVSCPMLVKGRCGIGNDPEYCEIARGVKQPTAEEIEALNV